MSYSQLVLSDRPLGYWDGPQVGRKNLLSSNQYSLESSTNGWIELNNSSISRITGNSWVGTSSLKITASSTSSSGAIFSSGNRIQVYPGRFYTMIARVKRLSGSRNASIRIQYYTTQNGSTLSESERMGQQFTLSNSEWTTIYHTEIVPASSSVNYFAAWGVITNSGSSNDEILVDGVQFFEGPLYQIYDEQYDNDSVIRYYDYKKTKPIIFGANNSIKLNNQSFIEIPNDYKLFIQGSEDKTAALEFWFSLEKPPAYRHNLVSLGSGISCYIENDQVFIDYQGTREFIRISDWSKQHHIYLIYSNRQISVILNNSLRASVSLGSDFSFSKAIEFVVPNIIIGPSSDPYNLVGNPSFEDNTISWTALNSSLSTTTSDSYSGDSCLVVTKQASANSGCSTDALKMLDPYKNYSLSAYVKIPTGEESANIQLKCNIYSNFNKSELISTYIKNISISNNNWNRMDLSFTTDLTDRVAEIIISQPTAGTNGETFLVDAVLLEKSLVPTEWSENSYNSDPLFINSVALYSHDIGELQRQKRITYATNDIDNQLAIQEDADIFNIKYSNYSEVERINLISKIDSAILNSLSSNSVGIYNIPLSPEVVTVGPNGGSANISEYGLELTGDAYLNISQSAQFFNVSSSTLRIQTKFDSTSGNGYLLFIDGVLNNYGLAIKKYNNKIQGVIIQDIGLTEEPLFETQTLSSGNLNIALNFSGLFISAKVGNQEFNSIAIPPLLENCQLTIGNIPDTNNTYPDAIRNFAIDDLTEFSNINWIKTGKYMLRMTEDLNVSQRSQIDFSVKPTRIGNNTVFTINTAGNNAILINNEIVKDNNNIPQFDYSGNSEIDISVILESDNSTTGYSSFNSAHLATFNSDTLNSNLGNFSLSHNLLYEDVYQDTYVDEYGGYIEDPFIIQTVPSNILSHDDNLGIRFTKIHSSGCKIIPNNSSIKCLEFVFKVNLPPNRSEIYNIFDVSGVSNINLKLNYQGLIKSGAYDLYIDGSQITNLSSIDIVPGEFYHLFIVFPSNISNEIYLGKDKSLLNCIDGSIGKINLYRELPTNHSQFISDKYQDIIGRITRLVDGGSLNLRDSDLTQQYYRSDDENYYEMLKLPKIKIFNNA